MTQHASIGGSALVLSLCLLQSSLLHADSDEYSSMAHLASTVPVVGGTTDLIVRSPIIGAQVLLMSDLTLGPLNAGDPSLPVLCLSPSAILQASGSIDTSGRFQATMATPPLGTSFFIEAILVGPSGKTYASNCVMLISGSSSTATFTDGTLSLDADTSLYAAADVDWADLNKDGCLDAIVANNGMGAQPLILMGDCTGNLTNEASLRLPPSALHATSCVEVADVNGDSWPDLFLGGGQNLSSPGRNLLLINDGSGHFQTLGGPSASLGGRTLRGACRPGKGCATRGFPGGKGLAVDAEFGDADGDGDLDLLVTNVQDPDHPGEKPDAVTLYENDPRYMGMFAPVARFLTPAGGTTHKEGGDASFGDVDNDGDLDVFVAGADTTAGGSQNQLYVNDGSANFTNVTNTSLPLEPDNSFEADFGDFDGDGDLDIFVANSIISDPTAIHLYENRTTTPDHPVFVDASLNVPASFGGTTDIRLSTDVGDVDADGDLDILVGIHELFPGNPTDGEAVLLINQGGSQAGTQGIFEVDAGFLPGLFIDADLAFGDVDSDGDLDIYIANAGNLFQFNFQDQLWINEL